MITVVDVVGDTGIQLNIRFTIPNLVHNCTRMRGKALNSWGGGRNVVGVTNVSNQRCEGLPWYTKASFVYTFVVHIVFVNVVAIANGR